MSEIDQSGGENFVDVALDIPVRQLYTYRCSNMAPRPGCRVRVPMGRRQMTGVVVATRVRAPAGISVRDVVELLDQKPLFSKELVHLVEWCGRYYHQPLGEFWSTALPAVLRRGLPVEHGLEEVVYRLPELPDDWESVLQRAPVQARIVRLLIDREAILPRTDIVAQIPGCQAALKALLSKGLLVRETRILSPGRWQPEPPEKVLTGDQQAVLDRLLESSDGFSCSVLEGVTGSGKTEVYFGLIDRCLASNRQALVLLPEIALTDQLLNRFEQRFGSRVVQVHSGMSDATRHRRWWEIHSGRVEVVLATRSGVFQSFKNLGLIVVDEEHDASFKQQEGVRYHARSVAIKRAQLQKIPVVLGSATPSLETCYNIDRGVYRHLELAQRAGQGVLPEVSIVDLNRSRPEHGLSPVSTQALREVLASGRQSLVFINRRGYAPVLYCADCQWSASCRRCDARMTLHRPGHRLQCHHCGAQRGMPDRCDNCGSGNLVELGEGTQRIEQTLGELFPDARIQRFDRDELSTESRLQAAMHAVHRGEVDILVGTQLLSKGHDFSRVDLVLVINADQGLHSIDFRAPELLVQQLIQVAGRAGRADARGRVLIQTWLPRHPALAAVAGHDYRQFVRQELQLREQSGFPPYSHIALWRVRASRADEPLSLLEQFAELGRAIQPEQTRCFDPVTSPMFKRGGQYHAQLLCSASQRSTLHQWLDQWIRQVEAVPRLARSRWSIDVDPLSLF